MVFRTTWQQYFEEEAEGKAERGDTAAKRAAAAAPAPQAEGSAGATSEGAEASPGPACTGAARASALEGARGAPPIPRGRAASVRRYSWHAGPENLKKQVQVKDGVLTLLVLAVVVLSSSFRFHSAACQNANPEQVYEVCHHPVFQWLGKDTLQRWMHDGRTADFLNVFSFASPLALCAAVMAHYNCVLIRKQGWRAGEVMLYDAVSVATGMLAGLVGIGGGLIISPFLIVMNLEPAVAVATSSTCVIFTSSSTTLQYLLTDRIIMSLTIAYGIANLAASYAGTSLVHMIQEREEKLSRRWYISSIVGAGVFLSTVLALTQMVGHHEGH
ncbi:unnamed protein product [Prorocentrum cordatum]|uniref:Uncharacterized protein n=1 Tax=Prorocentrum cordatum TaxID=2364126 RepID=A0ABN9U732_9DINO|nr:unnamed protein product [Polarella glacialis]